MRFSDIIGNEDLKTSVIQMIETDRLGHAILLCEAGNYGAFAFALAIASYVNCREPKGDSCAECPSCHKYGKLIHPDLHFVFPVTKSDELSDSDNKKPVSDFFVSKFRTLALANPYFSEDQLYDAIGVDDRNTLITVNEARNLMEKLSLVAFEGRYKTVIVYLPEKMNREAANALLKLLEEPPVGTLFLLVTHSPEKLLTTIRSRCMMLTLKPLSKEERVAAGVGSAEHADYLRTICSIFDCGLSGKLSDTFPEWEHITELSREKQKDFCQYAESFVRKIHLVSLGLERTAELDEDEMIPAHRFAEAFRPSFYQNCFTVIENALPLIGANVSSKLIFCDMCNRIYYYLCRV